MSGRPSTIDTNAPAAPRAGFLPLRALPSDEDKLCALWPASAAATFVASAPLLPLLVRLAPAPPRNESRRELHDLRVRRVGPPGDAADVAVAQPEAVGERQRHLDRILGSHR